MAISMGFRGPYDEEVEVDFQSNPLLFRLIKPPLAIEDEINELAKAVGLHSWQVGQITLEQEEKFQETRARMVELIATEKTSLKECRSALTLLHRLFVLDPTTENTTHNLQTIIQQLSKLFENESIGNFRALRPDIIEIYSRGIECLMRDSGRYANGAGVIPREVQRNLLKGPEALRSLNRGRSIEVEFHIEYAKEGVKRIATEENLKKLTSILTALGHFALNLIGAEFSLATLDIPGIKEKGEAIAGQAKQEMELQTAPWFEEGYIFRRIACNGLRTNSEGEQPIIAAINGIHKLIFSKSGQKIGLRKLIHPKSSKECSWKIFLSAAQGYKHIILHYTGHEKVYQQSFGSLEEKTGLMGLVTLAKGTINYQKVERGVSEILQKVLTKEVIDKFPKSEEQRIWRNLQIFAGSIEISSVHKRDLERALFPYLQKMDQGRRGQQESFVSEEEVAHKHLFNNVMTFEEQEIQDLLSKGANPIYYQDKETGNTALHLVAESGRADLFRRFLADLKDLFSLGIKNKLDQTPYSLAMNNSSEEMKKVITEFFYKSIEHGKREEVEFFLDLGQNPDDFFDRRSPVGHAISCGKFEIAQALIVHGAVRSPDLDDVFVRAFRSQEIEKVEFLLNKGVGRDKIEMLFSYAVERHLFRIAQFLIEEEWVGDINKPLQRARRDKNYEGVEFLLRNNASA